MSETKSTQSATVYGRIRDRLEKTGFSPGVVFILPTFLLIAGLLLYPMINTFLLSLGITEGGFTFANYEAMVSADWFVPLIRNSVVWVLLGALLQITFGFALALLLNTKIPGKKVLRGLYLLPWITPAVVVALVFKWMYNPQFGIINHALIQIGLIDSAIGWLSNPDLALFSLVIAGLWKRFPFVMIMLLAGLQDVDDQLQNAAIIDGAPYLARMRHVTLPQLMPVLKIVVLLSVIWCFNQFAIIYAATGGGPVGSTMIFPVKVYELGFEQLDFGLSTALSVFMFGIMLVFMMVYMRVLRNRGVDL
ncbi:carbohydrate ABC transporter permease [Halomarina halobia]|uniref:Carbohydrate ABC transporter permease n=1 Tax=Halomarina halobia TaxID=3033386 RepID=A0ABD6ACQ8_9EURY|nr:sugar ABC transporter permease [Halomarina sp. PSR21]